MTGIPIVSNEVYIEHGATIKSQLKLLQALDLIPEAVLLKTEFFLFMQQPKWEVEHSESSAMYTVKMPIPDMVLKVDVLMHTDAPYKRVVNCSIAHVASWTNDMYAMELKRHLEVITDLDTYIGSYPYVNNFYSGVDKKY